MAESFICRIPGAGSNRSRNLVQHESLAPLGPERQFRGLFFACEKLPESALSGPSNGEILKPATTNSRRARYRQSVQSPRP